MKTFIYVEDESDKILNVANRRWTSLFLFFIHLLYQSSILLAYYQYILSVYISIYYQYIISIVSILSKKFIH